ncbi:vesicle coat component [Boothiomyces macroporosus]|uniref:Vesicle coat component n=1 Tax=Boothiomyces macroporosus TaxID=261099 RepID=A0AAD5Y445_9FUNG|nr:vesicle coat component [Boothiomyces macroporosus]
MLFLLIQAIAGLRFELTSPRDQQTRCFEQFIPKDTLVKGQVDCPNRDGLQVDFLITDSTQLMNKHYSKNNLYGNQKFSFTTHVDANVKYCFTAISTNSYNEVKRPVFLHVETSHQQNDNEFKGKFSEYDRELSWLQQVITDSLVEMNTYEQEDTKLNLINEQTKERVFNFSSMTFLVLVVVGGWQIWYLHSYFKKKHLI